MCNERIILLAGINGKYITYQQAQSRSPFKTATQVASNRRKRWADRFKRRPMRDRRR